jgi:hypothetical protein
MDGKEISVELSRFEKYIRLSTVCNMIMMYASEMGNKSSTAQSTRLDNGLTNSSKNARLPCNV